MLQTRIKNGRKQVLVDKKWIYYYIYIWEQKNGIKPTGYVIHHKDFDKTNDDITNLELLTLSEHISLHNKNASNETHNKWKWAASHRSEEYIEKIKQAAITSWQNSEKRKNRCDAMKNKKRSVEARKNISESKKGKALSEETKRKISETQKGRKKYFKYGICPYCCKYTTLNMITKYHGVKCKEYNNDDAKQ